MLRALINTVRHILRPGNPNIPIEIHFVTMGFAGFSVDVGGWGDRSQVSLMSTIHCRDMGNVCSNFEPGIFSIGSRR